MGRRGRGRGHCWSKDGEMEKLGGDRCLVWEEGDVETGVWGGKTRGRRAGWRRAGGSWMPVAPGEARLGLMEKEAARGDAGGRGPSRFRGGREGGGGRWVRGRGGLWGRAGQAARRRGLGRRTLTPGAGPGGPGGRLGAALQTRIWKRTGLPPPGALSPGRPGPARAPWGSVILRGAAGTPLSWRSRKARSRGRCCQGGGGGGGGRLPPGRPGEQ